MKDKHAITPTKTPHVAIVILNWNNAVDTVACLKTVDNVIWPSLEVVIVDNNSSGDSVAEIASSFPQHSLQFNSENLGFSEGNNVAIRSLLHRYHDYVLLLNPDTTVTPEFLKQLVEVGEKSPKIGIVGPCILYHDNPEWVWSAGGRINPSSGRYEQNNGPVREDEPASREVEWVSGCCLLIKTEVIRKIGFLDPDFFLGTEDVDWCLRARKAGYRVIYVPRSIVYHKKPLYSSARNYSPRQHYYSLRNLLIFIEKHGRFNPAFILSYMKLLTLRVGWCLLTFDVYGLKAIWRAILDFRQKRYGHADWPPVDK